MEGEYALDTEYTKCAVIRTLGGHGEENNVGVSIQMVKVREQNNIERLVNTEEDFMAMGSVYKIKKGDVLLVEYPAMMFTGKHNRGDTGSCLSYASYLSQSKKLDAYKEVLDKLHPRTIDKRITDEAESFLKENKEYGMEYAIRYVSIAEKLIRNVFACHKEGEHWACIYVFASYINHSCEPNAEWRIMDDFSLRITALRDIKPKEEITICYNDNILKYKNKMMRRRVIFEHMRFVCKCKKCRE